MARPHPRTVRRSITRLATLALALAGVAGCQHNSADAKTASARVGGVDPIPANSFKVQQFALLPMKGDKPTAVFVRDNFVIVYTQQFLAYVLDRDSLAVKWIARISQEPVHVRPPVVLKDYVVFPTVGTLEVYDRLGRNHRSVTTRGIALRSRVVGDGTRLFFGGDASGGGRLECLDLQGSQYQNNSLLWELATRGGISAAPALAKGFCYVGDEAGGVYAVNAENRQGVWGLQEENQEPGVFHTSGAIRADVKADNTGVYVASMDTRLYCLGSADGKIVWRYFGGVPLVHSPELTASTVYLQVDGQGVVALDKNPKGDSIRSPRYTVTDAVRFLAEDARFAYMLTSANAIVAVDAKTGAVKFRSKRHDFADVATTGPGNTIYTVTTDGELRATVPVLKAGGVGELASLGGNVEMQPVMASTH